jgi:hypothetical protein
VRAPITALIALWTVGLGVGGGVLFAYKYSPGEAASVGRTFPGDSALRLDPALPTLILFAHPKCTCTRASLTELAALLELLHDQLAARVVFMQPGDTDGDWAETDTWRQANRLAGVTVSIDRDGREAQRFAARTSGQTLLYAPDGAQLFAGGITGSRGHVGDNAGRQRLTALVLKREVDRHTAPVFGCALGAFDRKVVDR